MRTRTITIMVVIVCLVGLVVGEGVTQENGGQAGPRPSPAARATGQSEEQEEVRLPVVVETYLVLVDMDALYGFGVAAVPQKADETVTVPRLVSCLANPDDGRVMDATRVAANSLESAEVESKSTEYVRRTTTGSASAAGRSPAPNTPTGPAPVQSVRFQSYDSGTDVRVTSHATRAAYPKIRLQLSYSHSGFFSSEAEEDAPPSTINYDLRTEFEVKDGQAVVAGGKQTGNRGLFLVVRASVVGEN